MKTTLIKLPVVSFRKIVSPYEEKLGQRMYIAVASVKDIPEEFEEWRTLNPRDPRLSSGVARQIEATLRDQPATFFLRNRGITLIAERTEFDNKKNILSLEMVDRQRNGLLDGGHTFRVIRQFVEELPEEELDGFNAFVRLEILEGITERDAVVDIVDSRNTSTQVKSQSIEELRQHYDEVKKILAGKLYADRIAYKEFEFAEEGSPKDIDVKEVLSYLVCFDVEGFDNKAHPIKAYSGKAAVVQHFKENRQRMLKYIPLLPQILELRDIIYAELPDAYNSQGGKFGRLTGVLELSSKPRMKSVVTPYIEAKSHYRIPSGFIYPILAAFRNLVEVDKEKCKWKTDPAKLFQELKEELASRIGEQALEFRNPNKLGKDNATWGRCYDLVELEVLRRKL